MFPLKIFSLLHFTLVTAVKIMCIFTNYSNCELMKLN